jgi:DNA uptake protein ComE-like DNA-binding protein
MRLIRYFTLLAAFVLMTGAVCAQAPAKAVDKAAKAAGKPADKTATKALDKAADKAGALIDINRATPAELKSIPGIGDAYSAAIVKGRPYANKAQLKSKGVVPDGVYEKIKDKIIAKQ